MLWRGIILFWLLQALEMRRHWKCNWFSRNSNCFQMFWMLVTLQCIQALTTSMIQQVSQFVVPCCNSISFHNYSLPPTTGVIRLHCAQVYLSSSNIWRSAGLPEPITTLENTQLFQCTGADSSSIFIDILQSLAFTLGTVVMHLYATLPYSLAGLGMIW